MTNGGRRARGAQAAPSSSSTFEVEAITNVRFAGRQNVEYLVQWKVPPGANPDDYEPTWEAEDNLEGCEDALRDFRVEWTRQYEAALKVCPRPPAQFTVCPESPPRQRSLPSRRRRPRKRRSRCRCSTCRTVTPTPSLRSRRASRGPLHAPARRQGLRGLQGQADAARQDDRAQSAGAARRHPRGCRRGHRHQVLGRRARATAYAARRLSDSRGF